jgi:predicted esterase
MPLTEAQLLDLQADAMANDVPIDVERMAHWTVEQATEFFESGGAVLPAAQDSDDARATVTPSLAPSDGKLRIACLHGTAGCEPVLRLQLAALLRELDDIASFVFIEGGLRVLPESWQPADNEHERCRATREAREQALALRKVFGERHPQLQYAVPRYDEDGARTYDDLTQAVMDLEAALAARGGADVLLGFSQGANLATVLSACARPPFRAVVLLSPSKPGWVRQLPSLFSTPIATPAIVAASDDERYAEEHALGSGATAVAGLYSTVSSLTHRGPGHRPLPAKADADFLRQIRAALCEACALSVDRGG